MVKISDPMINQCVDCDLSQSIEANYFYNGIYTFGVSETSTVYDAVFDCCVFRGVDFSNIKLDRVELVDVLFENCDLSNQVFDNKLIKRVRFDNCKMTGVSFVKSSLQDVRFVHCKATYINFAEAGIKLVEATDCNFEKLFLYAAKVKYLFLNNVDLMGAEISDTDLRGTDFSTCRIDGIRADYKSLKGIIIDKFQAYNLVQMLGVKIKD